MKLILPALPQALSHPAATKEQLQAFDAAMERSYAKWSAAMAAKEQELDSFVLGLYSMDEMLAVQAAQDRHQQRQLQVALSGGSEASAEADGPQATAAAPTVDARPTHHNSTAPGADAGSGGGSA